MFLRRKSTPSLPVALALALLTLSGCSGGEEPSAGTSSISTDSSTGANTDTDSSTGANTGTGTGTGTVDEAEDATTPVVQQAAAGIPRRAWTRQLQAVSRIRVAGGDTGVTIVRARGDELDIVALDLADGLELWRSPYQAFDIATTSSVGVTVLTSTSGKEYVVFQRAGVGDRLRDRPELPVLVADPRTGEIVHRTEPVVLQWPITPCDDNVDACLATGDAPTFAKRRLDLDTFELDERRNDGRGRDEMVTEGGVLQALDLNSYRTRAVGRVDGAKTLWRRPVRDLIDGPGEWYLPGDSHGPYLVDEQVVLVSLTRDFSPPRRGGVTRSDVGSSHRTLALDATTGETLWTRDGATVGCMFAQYAGQPVLCEFNGTRLSRENWRQFRYRDLLVSLRGIDSSTGESTWQVDFSDVAAKLIIQKFWDDREVRVLDNDELRLLDTKQGAAVVSLIDGSSAAAKDTSLLCSRPVRYDYALDTYSSYETRDRLVHFACDAAAKPVPGTPSALALAMTGLAMTGLATGQAEAPDIRVVIGPEKLVAYRIER